MMNKQKKNSRNFCNNMKMNVKKKLISQKDLSDIIILNLKLILKSLIICKAWFQKTNLINS